MVGPATVLSDLASAPLAAGQCPASCRVQDLDPVAIWVLHKCQPLHLAIIRPLHKLNTQPAETAQHSTAGSIVAAWLNTGGTCCQVGFSLARYCVFVSL